MRGNLPHFRIPRAIDPRRHHDVRAWADAEREAARHHAPPDWRRRTVYGLIAAALLVIVVTAIVRLL